MGVALDGQKLLRALIDTEHSRPVTDGAYGCEHLTIEQRQVIVRRLQSTQMQTPSRIHPTMKHLTLFVGDRILAGGTNQLCHHPHIG